MPCQKLTAPSLDTSNTNLSDRAWSAVASGEPAVPGPAHSPIPSSAACAGTRARDPDPRVSSTRKHMGARRRDGGRPPMLQLQRSLLRDGRVLRRQLDRLGGLRHRPRRRAPYLAARHNRDGAYRGGRRQDARLRQLAGRGGVSGGSELSRPPEAPEHRSPRRNLPRYVSHVDCCHVVRPLQSMCVGEGV